MDILKPKQLPFKPILSTDYSISFYVTLSSQDFQDSLTKKCSQNKIIVLVINKRIVKKQREENPMSEKGW